MFDREPPWRGSNLSARAWLRPGPDRSVFSRSSSSGLTLAGKKGQERVPLGEVAGQHDNRDVEKPSITGSQQVQKAVLVLADSLPICSPRRRTAIRTVLECAALTLCWNVAPTWLEIVCRCLGRFAGFSSRGWPCRPGLGVGWWTLTADSLPLDVGSRVVVIMSSAALLVVGP